MTDSQSTTSNAQASAAELRALGFAICKPDAGTKKPTYKRWSTQSLEPSDFAGNDLIGILGGPLSACGHPGHALVIIDLDDQAAVELADGFLPTTTTEEGREGKPRDHRYYLVTLDTIPAWAMSSAEQASVAAKNATGHAGPVKKQFRHPETGKCVIDFIGTGGQAVCPGGASPRQWVGGFPCVPSIVSFDDLWGAVCRLAEACGCKLPGANGHTSPDSTEPAASRGARKSKSVPGMKTKATSGPTAEDRARAYLEKIPPAISEQGGHAQTYDAATCVVYGFDLGVERGLALLLAEYNPRCVPPWSEPELRHKCVDADTKPHSKPRGWLLEERSQSTWRDSHTSNGKAEERNKEEPNEARDTESITDPHRLARRWTGEYAAHDDRPTVAYFRSTFWQWTGWRWQQKPDKEFEGEVCRDVKRIIDKDYPAWAEAFAAATEKPAPPVPKVTGALVSNVLLALRGAHLLGHETPQPSWLGGEERPAKLFACSNGLLDIDALLRGESKVLLPHTPLWFSPCLAPYPFESRAACPTWNKVLRTSLADDVGKQLLLQQFAGYLLTVDLSQQQFLELVGEGANGKSVILAGLTAMLGEDNVSAVPLELFADKFRLIGTLGKLANIAAEIGELEKMAEGHLKAFVSGDAMEFEQKFKQPFRSKPSARLVFSTNNSPQYSDRSDGIFRRRIVLPFKIQIPPSERIPNLDKVEYWQQSGELPGMLNWALAGLVSLKLAKVFTVPASCKTAADKLRIESDPARRFLLDHYEAGEDKIEKLAIYQHYRSWVIERGHCPMAEVGFGRAVCRVFPRVNSEERVITAMGRKTAYGGLKVKTEPIPS